MDGSVVLDGSELTPRDVARIARDHASVAIASGARERMLGAAAVVARAAHAGTPVYGLTTGLGPRVVERIDGAAAAEFSLRTLRGRAMSVGEP
ncbi:MAG: aromatic amino acid lyase, partial [Solirubrobacteraceae bacterium]